MQSLDVISVNIWQILISLCNLLLLFLILKRFLFKPVSAMMEKRRQSVEKQYQDAQKAEDEAEASKKEWQEKLEGAHKEAASILQDASEVARKRETELLADARIRADEIVQRAETEAELEKRKAAADRKREIAEAAAALAGKMLDREIREEDHRDLIDSFIREMEETHE